VLVPSITIIHVIRQISAEALWLVGQADSQFDKADLKRRAGQCQFEFRLRDHSSSRIGGFGPYQNQLDVAIDQPGLSMSVANETRIDCQGWFGRAQGSG